MTNTNTTSRPFPGQKSKTGRKSASFHGRLPTISDDQPQIPRPESHPELLRRLTIAGNQQLLPAILPENAAQRQAVAGKRHQLPVVSPESAAQKLTKLLLNVMIQGSLGPVHVVMSPENTVEYLIKAAVDMYVKEGRRPLLAQTDPRGFDLHYSQFSLESDLFRYKVPCETVLAVPFSQRSSGAAPNIMTKIALELLSKGI